MRVRVLLLCVVILSLSSCHAKKKIVKTGRRDIAAASKQLQLANQKVDSRQLEQAVGLYETALQLDPYMEEAYFNLGNVLKDLNRYYDSELAYLNAIKVQPANANSYFNLGVLHRRTNNITASIQAFKSAVRLNPKFSKAYNVMGFQLSEAGQTKQAVNSYLAALTIDPYYDAALLNFAGLALDDAVNNTALVLKHAQKFCKKKTQDVGGLFLLGNALEITGHTGEALKQYSKVLSLLPKVDRGYYFFGLSYTTTKKCPRMDYAINNKVSLQRQVMSLAKKHPSMPFDFLPRAYFLPEQYEQFTSEFTAHRNVLWILKPPERSDARGIQVVQNISQVPQDSPHWFVQRYIPNPWLIDGHKFDLRLYALVTSLHPLRLYFYPDGVSRFASDKYTTDAEQRGRLSVHLTNDEVNKGAGIGCGPMRLASGVMQRLRAEGLDTQALWEKIHDIAVKAVLGISQQQQPPFPRDTMCFKTYGLDVLIDAFGEPWLLEVNQSPSFGVSCNNEYRLKGEMLTATLQMMLSRSSEDDFTPQIAAFQSLWTQTVDTAPEEEDFRRFVDMEAETRHAGLWNLIYPYTSKEGSSPDPYAPLLSAPPSDFDVVAAAWLSSKRASNRAPRSEL